MTDSILKALDEGRLNKENISFLEMRKVARASTRCNDELKQRLDHGRAVLRFEPELDQYLHTYGPMILSQWGNLIRPGNHNLHNLIRESIFWASNGVQIIDYGCGQGTGSVIFHRAFDDIMLEKLISCHLIDLSTVALKRAKGVTECCFPNAKVIALNKDLDDLNERDIRLDDKTLKIHIFSNILDIDSFNGLNLLKKSLSIPGEHLIIAVSQDRGFNGGSPRVREIYQLLERLNHSANFDIKRNCGIRYFKCSNPSHSDAITFCFYLERYDGSIARSTETRTAALQNTRRY